jgi:EAL domain-containing protein (putative c-di-GMP-specific phosphodiesterase class I)
LGKAMEGHIRSKDTLARLGGDEFGVLLEDCSLSDGWRATKELLKAIEDFRFAWNDRDFRIGASIGVVLVNDFSIDVTDVLANADGACYAAKEQGRNRIHVHADDDQQLKQRRGEMEWASRIPEALEANRFELFYQTIEPLADGGGHGLHVELLVRMHDADGNLILPGSFLPAAERYNLSTQIDRWVVSNAFANISQAQAAGKQIQLCTINLSGNSLGNEDFLEFVLGEFDATGVNPRSICFEVTETAAISNLGRAKRFITRLKQKGTFFSLDDFGTGLSSFAYLRELPVDFLKIDGVFVKDIAKDPIHLAMVRSINDVGHVMGMQTIAEFVESQEIMDKLCELGVDYAQGYHIARPRPASEIFQ